MNKEIEYIKNRAQGIARYSDKIRKQLIKIDEVMTPAIKEAGITYTFPEIVMTKNDEYFGEVNYRISVRKGTTNASGGDQYWGIFLRSDEVVSSHLQSGSVKSAGVKNGC